MTLHDSGHKAGDQVKIKNLIVTRLPGIYYGTSFGKRKYRSLYVFSFNKGKSLNGKLNHFHIK
ncbi:hypothetical protein GCM10011409_21110 [Lentibacillus populi]|uniref:Uncharacterized protein n=1 Tax=Lentibacillus populi TaxID=1827502 RepID=A0A9W5X5Z3_9BACI|nr:hypothetical protein GCM10011409_21110 [Lentibacillus populi]